MKVDMRLSTVENSMNQVGREMTFDANSMAHIKGVLGNLYKDPILAIIREYSTNAFDAHLMAGHQEPILVTLPTLEEPTFTVQDFGIGLAEEDVYGIFGSYGASTKRESNAFNGQLGFGSKSAFSYTSNFFVVSSYDGETSTYSVYEDAIGNGRILLLETEQTPNQRNGLKIIIPIKSDDISTFIITAQEFYTTFEPAPVFTSQKHNETQKAKRETREKRIKYRDGKNAIVQTGLSDESFVLMGNVPYIFNADDFKEAANMLPYQTHFELHAEIGEINFTPSREAVRLDPKSQAFISAAIKRMADKLRKEIAEQWDAADTLSAKFDVSAKYYNGNIVKNAFQVNDKFGKPIPTQQRLHMRDLTANRSPLSLRKYVLSHGGISSSSENAIFFHESVLLVDGVVQMPGDPFRRAATQLLSQGKYKAIYYINRGGDAFADGLFNEGEVPEYKAFIAANGGGTLRDPVARVNLDVLNFNYKGTQNYYGSFRGGRNTFSQSQKVQIDDKTFYVEIADSSFVLDGNTKLSFKSQHPSSDAESFIAMLHIFKELLGYKVVGVRSTYMAKFRQDFPEVPHYTEILRQFVMRFTAEEFEQLTIHVFGDVPYPDNFKFFSHPDMPEVCRETHALLLRRRDEKAHWEKVSKQDYNGRLSFIIRLYYSKVLKKSTRSSDTIVVWKQESLKRNAALKEYPILEYIRVSPYDGAAGAVIAQTLRKV